jgi:hypothetical protein
MASRLGLVLNTRKPEAACPAHHAVPSRNSALSLSNVGRFDQPFRWSDVRTLDSLFSLSMYGIHVPAHPEYSILKYTLSPPTLYARFGETVGRQLAFLGLGPFPESTFHRKLSSDVTPSASLLHRRAKRFATPWASPFPISTQRRTSHRLLTVAGSEFPSKPSSPGC